MKKKRRILAWAGIILLAAMYVITLLLAIFDNSATMSMFRASAACTMLVPIMIYIYTMVYKWTRGKDGMNGSEEEQEEHS